MRPIYKNQLHFCTFVMDIWKCKEVISFTIVSKRIKSLGINFTKEVQNVYSEDYKTLLIESKDLNK